MNARSYFSTDSANPIEPISELSRVVVLKGFETEDGFVPQGSKGTVVSVYQDGAAYCVEFSKPVSALVTVLCGDLEVTEEDIGQLPQTSAKVPDRH